METVTDTKTSCSLQFRRRSRAASSDSPKKDAPEGEASGVLAGQGVEVPQTGEVLLIRTLSGSRYLMDPAEMTVQRLGLAGRAPAPGAPRRPTLRRDGERIRVFRVWFLEVGKPAVLDLEPLGDPHLVTFTRRVTSDVVSIESVSRAAAEASSHD